MRFSDYLTETFWAAVDKALPLFYGVGYIFVVARTLPEEEFGYLAQIEIIYYFILMVDFALAQTPMAKFAAETQESVWAIPNGFCLSALVLIFCGAACMGAPNFFAVALNSPGLENILWCIPVLLAAGYFKNLTSQICVARHWTARLVVIDFFYFFGSWALLSIWKFSGALASAVQVILANVYFAVAASVIGVILTIPVMRQTSWRVRRQDLRRFLAFSRYSFGSGFGAYLNGNVDAVLVSHFFGTVPVAVYRAGKVIYRFYNAFSQAAQVVILPLASRFSASRQQHELRALFEKAIYFSYLLLLPLNLLLLLGADWIMAWLYAGKYTEAAPVFRWLLLGSFLLPWGTVGINLLLGAGKPQFSFRITWVVVAINIVVCYFFIKYFGINGAAMTMVITSLVGATLTAYYVQTLTHFTFRGIWQRHGDVLNFIQALRRRSHAISEKKSS